MSAPKKAGRPRKGLSDAEIESLCNQVRDEDHARTEWGSREQAFCEAAQTFDTLTRGERKRRRIEAANGKRPRGSYEGDLTAPGIWVLDALIDFAGRTTSPKVLAKYSGYSESTTRKALDRLATAGVIDPVTHVIRWERFGAEQYNLALVRRVLPLSDKIEKKVGSTSNFGEGVCGVLRIIAGFGRPGFLTDSLMLMCGAHLDEDRERVLSDVARLRRAGLVRPDVLEIDPEALERFAHEGQPSG